MLDGSMTSKSVIVRASRVARSASSHRSSGVPPSVGSEWDPVSTRIAPCDWRASATTQGLRTEPRHVDVGPEADPRPHRWGGRIGGHPVGGPGRPIDLGRLDRRNGESQRVVDPAGRRPRRSGPCSTASTLLMPLRHGCRGSRWWSGRTRRRPPRPIGTTGCGPAASRRRTHTTGTSRRRGSAGADPRRYRVSLRSGRSAASGTARDRIFRRTSPGRSRPWERTTESTTLIGMPGRDPSQILEPNPAFTDSERPMLFRIAPDSGFVGRWVTSAAKTLSLG